MVSASPPLDTAVAELGGCSCGWHTDWGGTCRRGCLAAGCCSPLLLLLLRLLVRRLQVLELTLVVLLLPLLLVLLPVHWHTVRGAPTSQLQQYTSGH